MNSEEVQPPDALLGLPQEKACFKESEEMIFT